MRFMEFMQHANMEEEKGDIKKTLAKLPPSHAALVQGFKWKFHAGNTLNGDNQHVGYMDDQEKEIAVAAPQNYGRQFCSLHEIAHKVWDRLSPQLKQQWNHICRQLTPRQKQDNNPAIHQEPTEIFCMAYGNYYADTKLVKFDNPLWMKFIANLPQRFYHL